MDGKANTSESNINLRSSEHSCLEPWCRWSRRFVPQTTTWRSRRHCAQLSTQLSDASQEESTRAARIKKINLVFESSNFIDLVDVCAVSVAFRLATFLLPAFLLFDALSSSRFNFREIQLFASWTLSALPTKTICPKVWRRQNSKWKQPLRHC